MKTVATILLSSLIFSMSSMVYAERDHRRGPPPEALEACAEQAVDTACSFTSPRGDEISGMCHETRKGDRACKPEGMGRGRGEGRGGQRPPPQDAG